MEKFHPETAKEVARYLTSIGGPSRSREDISKHWTALHHLDAHHAPTELIWPYYVHAATRSLDRDVRAYAIRRLSLHVASSSPLAWKTYPIFLRAAERESYSLARHDAIKAMGKYGGKIAERDLLRLLRRPKTQEDELAVIKELGVVAKLPAASIILQRMLKLDKAHSVWYHESQYYDAIAWITARANPNLHEAVQRFPIHLSLPELAAIRIYVASHPEKYRKKKPFDLANDLFALEQEVKERKLEGFMRHHKILD